MQVNLYEAKTRLSELVDQAHAGETVIIAKAGMPMAKLVPLDAPARSKIKFGLLKGQLEIAPDFDAPMSEEELALWVGPSDAKPLP
jgi:prevent-host-death family protein